MTAPPSQIDVDELRSRLRAKRRGLDFATSRDHSYAAVSRSLDLAELTSATTVGAYLADDGELAPRPLVEMLADRGVLIHLPVVDEDGLMRFRAWDPDAPLVEGRWGIPVPLEPSESRSADELDVIITPLVAVDRHGTRIGRGAGYYDRALAHRLVRKGRPVVVGYAHDFQLADDTLPRNPWDVPLDLLVTDERILRWTDRDHPRQGSHADRR